MQPKLKIIIISKLINFKNSYKDFLSIISEVHFSIFQTINHGSSLSIESISFSSILFSSDFFPPLVLYVNVESGTNHSLLS